MSKHAVDTVLRVRIRHVPGQLARLAAAVAEEKAVIGEIATLRLGEGDSVRDITVETLDDAHTQRVVEAVRKVQGVELLETKDRVFETHRGGKLHSTSRIELKQLGDLRYVYTPGVARVSRAIAKDPELAWDLTTLGNSVAICTNGTRVLGLGDIGPIASLPVMEGKAVLYDKFVGLSATPILIDTKDPKEFVDTVVRIARGFGAIHLEDIAIPHCFEIEDSLKARLAKPVMHDDQHGTATAALAAVLNVCKLHKIDPKRAKMGQIGLGAAGSAIARLAHAYGVERVMVTDLSREAVARAVSFGLEEASMDTILAEADIVVATTGRPGLILPEKIRRGQVVFSLSNPDPEIDPEEARAAGAAFAADGRSINNALAFPGLFRGALDAKSRAIVPEMLTTAAEVISELAEEGEIVPSPLRAEVHDAVRHATSRVARKLGLAGTAKL
jgi:malate dehydrogenase (oxaloacetate-decarboxylating)